MNRKKPRDTSATSPRPDLPRPSGQHPAHHNVERVASVPTAAPSMDFIPNEEKIAERDAQADEDCSGNQRRTALAIAAASVAWPPRQATGQAQDIGRSADEDDEDDDENDDEDDEDQDLAEIGSTAHFSQGPPRETMQAVMVDVGEGTAAGESTSGAPVDEAARAKREQRLAMNRISARERRKRKRLLIEQLQSSVMLLTRQNNELRERNTRLKQELLRLGGTIPPNIDTPSPAQPSTSSSAAMEGATSTASASTLTARSEASKEEATSHLSEAQLNVSLEAVNKGDHEVLSTLSGGLLGQGLPLSGADLGSIASSYAGPPHLALLARISGTQAGGTTNVAESLSRHAAQDQREGLPEAPVHGGASTASGEGTLGALGEQARIALIQQAAGGVQGGLLPILTGMGEQSFNPVEMLTRHLLLQEQNSLSLLQSQRQGLPGAGGPLGTAGDALQQQRSVLQGAAAAAALGGTTLSTLASSGTLGGLTPSQGAALLSAMAPGISAGVTGLDIGATQGVSSILHPGGLSANPSLSDLLSSLGGAASSGQQLPSSSESGAALLALRNAGLMLPDTSQSQQERQNPRSTNSHDETEEAQGRKMSGARKGP